jgi:hypothetical protein
VLGGVIFIKQTNLQQASGITMHRYLCCTRHSVMFDIRNLTGRFRRTVPSSMTALERSVAKSMVVRARVKNSDQPT